MTGELVLQQLKELQGAKPFAERLALALAKQGHQQLIEARDAFEDEGGHVHSWKDQFTGYRWCELQLRGERVALAMSHQSSADAEAHAFQNLYNDRRNAAGQGKEE